MSLDDLYKWREKFDTIKIKYWKTDAEHTPETAYIKTGKNIDIDSSSATPRLIHKRKNPLIFESVEPKAKVVS